MNDFTTQICLLPYQPRETAWVWSHQGLAFLAFLARAYKDAQSPKMDCFFQQTVPLLYTFLEKLEFSYEICHSISHPD